MKRILFVDDDPLVLQGLQRMLRPMRNEWQMTFLDGGAKALQFLEANPVDAVVSDMCMPDMNGAALLNEVMKRFPQTVRLVLSGHVDRDLILKCVGSTHQYLSKPCDAEALKATIQRASSIESTLQNERLQKLISQMDRLPSIPTLYTQIVELLQDPQVTIEEVGAIIGRDIGMTAKILKLVNSAFFGLGRDISTPAEAAAYLGLDTLKTLVLSINAFSQFGSAQIEGFSIDALQNHSLQTAAMARVIAREERSEQKLIDEAFIAGMLHDTGKLVMATNFPEQFNQVLHEAAKPEAAPCEIEKQIFGADHAEVGGYLLGLWGLPVPVVEAIALHHRPNHAAEKIFCPLTAVHVADSLAHEQSATDKTGSCGQLDTDYLGELQLGDRIGPWREATATLRSNEVPA